MSALSYVYSRLDDSSLVEFGKAAGVPVGKAAGVPVGKAAGVPVGKRGARGALRATGRKVRGGKTPVRRDFSPPSALGTNQPGKAQPEWMRSYGSPGPKTGW